MFKSKVENALEICNKELNERKKGICGESTMEQLEETIIPELQVVLSLIEKGKLPPVELRYLNSFACAFTIWGWNMQQPTELFVLLAQINNEYKDL